MANWNLPTLTDLYTNFMAYLKGRDDDAVRMNDSRVVSASNLPEHAKRWNDTAKTLQNWVSSAWSNLVLSIAGGGTGATTAAGARTALNVYSKSEVDVAVAALPTIVSNTSGGGAVVTTVNGPSVSLAAGTWLILAHVTYSHVGYVTSDVYIETHLYSGTTKLLKSVFSRRATASQMDYADGEADFKHILTLGSSSTVSIKAENLGTAQTVIMGGNAYQAPYIHAIKLG